MIFIIALFISRWSESQTKIKIGKVTRKSYVVIFVIVVVNVIVVVVYTSFYL